MRSFETSDHAEADPGQSGEMDQPLAQQPQEVVSDGPPPQHQMKSLGSGKARASLAPEMNETVMDFVCL